MSFISNLKLNHKLTLLVTVPILVMLSFSIYQSNKALKLRFTSTQLEVMVAFSVHASNLVHELQKERGMTAGFIGSKGQKFADKIISQRKLTDEKLNVFNHYIDNFNWLDISPGFANNLEQLLNRLTQLTDKRAAVNNHQLPLGSALSYYTGNNSALLSLIEQMSTQAPDQEMAIMISAYANYLQGKERAGIERAVLANTFSKDEFTGNLFNKFMALVTTQNVYSNVFLSLANEKDINFYRETLSGDFIEATDNMRKIAIDNSVSGGFDIDPTYWFKMQTGKINLLKKVENHLAQGLADKTQALKTAATLDFILISIISILGLLISIFLSISISKKLRKQIGGEPADIENITRQIANGSLSVDHKVGASTGIYAAIINMRSKLSDVIENEIQNIVDAARHGDLSKRVHLENKSGFYRSLGEGINDLVSSSEDIVTDTARIFSSLSRGDLNDSISRDYQGSFNQLKTDANTTIDRLRKIIEGDIQGLVQSSSQGDLSNRIILRDKEGFFKDISSGINQLIDEINKIFIDASDAMNSMAQGNLTKPIKNAYVGQFDEFKKNINSTISNLDDTITALRDTSYSIKSTANEIADGNNSLSSRTESQAAALEQTASSMEQLTSTVKNNAANTSQANKMADNAKITAESGGSVMKQASIAMEEINQSSQKIAEIIGVIDEIAFQTNLLALNASVEAARAGEQGRGFAVVATEVRNLAGRSATAAKEIKELISDSVNKVGIGVKLVDESTKNQNEIVESIGKVVSIISEISTASSEQSEGIEQVNQAITSMDDATQQNAALAEQTSAAAISLGDQTSEMNNSIEFFTLTKASSGPEPSTSAVKPAIKSAVPTKPVSVPSATASKTIAAAATKTTKEASLPVTTYNDDEWEEF